jgi:hypothetical protein
MRFKLPPDHPLNRQEDEYVSSQGVELRRTLGGPFRPDEPLVLRRRPGKFLREILEDYERSLRRESSDRAIPYLDRDGRWRR